MGFDRTSPEARSTRGFALHGSRPTAAVLLALVLGGCGGAFSRAPASDDATSRVDDRLLGFWRVDAESARAGDADSRREEAIVAVGRKAGAERVLEVATIEIRSDRTLDTTRSEFLATTIGGQEYASVRLLGNPPKPEDPPAWVVLRYEMPDADTVRVLGMDETTVAADVRAGSIPGTVSESKAGTAPATLTVTLEGTTEALRAWLEKRGDGVYRTARPLVLRRLRLP